mmetsp:Transcript_69698/g.207669  ORF Transcript_69698/g.207669 Transcript_69698/m.207669 type:complete len:206 (-) Transcript_69698:1574-2191(-)
MSASTECWTATISGVSPRLSRASTWARSLRRDLMARIWPTPDPDRQQRCSGDHPSLFRLFKSSSSSVSACSLLQFAASAWITSTSAACAAAWKASRRRPRNLSASKSAGTFEVGRSRRSCVVDVAAERCGGSSGGQSVRAAKVSSSLQMGSLFQPTAFTSAVLPMLSTTSTGAFWMSSRLIIRSSRVMSALRKGSTRSPFWCSSW